MCSSLEDKDGVTVDRFEDIYIPLPKGITRCSLTISRGDSGAWYTSFSLHLATSGGGYGPWPKFSKKYANRDEAVVAGARLIQKAVNDTKETKLVNGKAGKQLLEALDEVIARHTAGTQPAIVQETFAFALSMAPVATSRTAVKRPKASPCLIVQTSLFYAAEQTLAPEPQSALSGVDGFRSQGFTLDEAKLLHAGFSLVRFNREKKTVEYAGMFSGPEWNLTAGSPYATYTQAERELQSFFAGMKQWNPVKVSLQGNAYCGNNAELAKAGFVFYRQEGVMPGHGTPRIKSSDKNWGTWRKYETGAEVLAAWAELMKDEKALEG